MSNYVFAEEEYTKETVDEILPLLIMHWKEIAMDKSIPLNPDFDKYTIMAEAGMLHCMSVRTEEGELVGYMISFLSPHPHYKDTIYVENDILYIKPEHRKGMLGVRMIKAFEGMMKEAGVEVLQIRVKRSKVDFGPVLERLGFEEEDIVYRKRIGD